MSKEIEDHCLFNRSGNEPFSTVLERRVSRRSIMRGGLNVAAVSMLAGFGLTACSDDDDDDEASVDSGDEDMAAAMTLAFAALTNENGQLKRNAVGVPPAGAAATSATAAGGAAAVSTVGYTAQVVVPWGTPINSAGSPWRADLRFTPAIQENAVGMNHDGMYHFPISEETASSNFILALNNEYIEQQDLWAPQDGPTEAADGARPAEEVRTEINAHGVTLVELRRGDNGQWSHVMNSPYNRRFTSATPMNLSGPVAGSTYVRTAYSPDGTTTRGTNNNCANGYTPWGTYLTCEENWPNVFMKASGRESDDERLGLPVDGTRYGWQTPSGDASEIDGEFARFDATPSGASALEDYRNEPRTFGYIVEIDPYTDARAVKRTALGRFRHEGCWPGKLVAGEPVVFYTGHDSRNEYIYKYVSDAVWDPNDANRPDMNYSDRLAIGAKYMDSGTLYAAKFNADGSGEWLALTPDTMLPDGSQTLAAALGLEADDLAGVIIHTCDAADLMGATPMDRPEWGAVDPASGEVYMTLTNNSDRTALGTDATYSNSGSDDDELGVGFATAPVNAANPRPGSDDGHVIRWVEPSPGDTVFSWDIFVFGKVPSSDDENLSGLSEQNYFSSCDGLWYDDRGDGQGILWIQTDTGGTDFTNDQVLAVVPQGLAKADGAVINQANQARLKRFAVGPTGCEVTGIFATPDKTALFINIQHPANWPADDSANEQDATIEAAGTVRARASTVVIQKTDGGQIAV